MAGEAHAAAGDAAVPRLNGVVGVLLAAGAGSRFGGPTHKLLAPLPATAARPSEAVVARSAAAAVDALGHGLDALVVVTGAADVDDSILDVVPEFDRDRVIIASNPSWADGQATSIAVGLETATRLGAAVAVIGLADQPGVPAATWRAVAAVASAPDAQPITVASYDGAPRNPVALHRSMWPLLPTTGDTGARDLIRMRRAEVTAVPSAGSSVDIDTVEDHQRWQSS